MARSGLHEVLEKVYAVNHMLSGKPLSKAVSDFLLVDDVLHILFTKELFGISVPRTHYSDMEETDSSESDECVVKAVVLPINCWRRNCSIKVLFLSR